MTRNLIMGSAVGYDVDDLRVFLRSAAENAPSADVLLMSDRGTPEFESRLRAIHPRVHVAPVGDSAHRHRLWRSVRRRRKLKRLPAWKALMLRLSLYTPWRQRGLAAFHAACAKHFWNREGLNHPAARAADRILLADTRDLLFQADPFNAPQLPRDGLLMAAEPRLIDASSFVFRLIERIYGPETARRMLDQPVLCSGAVLGTRESIARYLDAMTRELVRQARHSFGRFVDQPIHCKVMLADNALPFTATAEGDTWITNLLYLNEPYFRVTESGLTTLDGRLVSIVHRYDRFPKLVDWANRRFGAPGTKNGKPPIEGSLEFPTEFEIEMGIPSVLKGSRSKVHYKEVAASGEHVTDSG